MYLKRLESAGFKSFAERINVEFVPGVTAVVGPNGSGKSNIIDAIRWVLGEQSAKSLRGSKMEDIIFQGSDSRKPLNVADVTLVLDNSDSKLPLDYEEVSITRRVYRSGDSEFYINKQACRLKDIIDLFMDSGLGREAFSIISQGKVEEILSSKAEERRTIFEEAAGVLKYKLRKKKAEFKLAETQENMNRVEDILHEIETQMGPLEKQAETAKEYIRKKELLKNQEISLLIAEIEKIYSEWQAILADMEQEKIKEIEIKTAIQQKEAQLENERQIIFQLDDEIEKLQASLVEKTRELEQLEGKKQVLAERSKHYGENKEKVKSEKAETKSRIEKIQLELETENIKLQEMKTERDQTKETAANLESTLTKGNANISDQIEELKSVYIELLNRQAAKRNERHSIKEQQQQMEIKKDKQLGKFTDLLEIRKEAKKKLTQMKQEIVRHEQRLQEMENERNKLKSDLDNERIRAEEAQIRLYQGYQYVEKLKSKKEMLEEMKEEFQGFFYGVKAVLKARDDRKLSGIQGAVIELIDVPNNIITAIETVLGGQAQHIIAVDDDAARKAIFWLKQTNQGRATFLPLASIQPRYVPGDILQKVKNHQGFIGIAADLVFCDKQFQHAINHLMGHIIISQTLQDANEIAKLAMRKYRIVTMDGDVVSPGGSMSGGAKKKTNLSLFTRDKDLLEVTKKLQEFQSRTTAFEQKVADQKYYIQKMEDDLEKAQEIVQHEQKILAETRTSHAEMEAKERTLDDNLALYDQDKKQFDSEKKALDDRKLQLDKDLDSLKTQLEHSQKKMNELIDQDSELKENQEQLENALHKSQITLAEQEERVKSQYDKTNTLHRQLDELKDQHTLFDIRLQELSARKQDGETETEINENIQLAFMEKNKVAAEIQEKRSDRSNRTVRIQDQEREIKEEQKQHQAIMKEIQHKEVKRARYDVELENRLSHLQTEYTITYEKAKTDYEKAENLEQAKEAVVKLKTSIDRLGTVNLGAIDEFVRVKTRYQFLTKQKNDLTEAKQTLHDAINEMDVEMEKRFGTTFSQIKQEFAIVFRELFGGGHAELKLTEPNNLLDTGVDIIAQPPGKKLQHLGLLSGGERALTAIALLFSILRVRPVPFCILDEVEAALDEANVARFAKYVKIHSEATQFIVITHRKGTMEEAHVLYGVTMQESGVSRLVSVRLEETRELVES